tara:strand:- start:31 stop:669 length:639 start_codon:yes stop_codon:yes gene_type:complete
MSTIIQKLSELSKLNITLPISEQTLQINKINLEVQSKFEQFATKYKNEVEATLKFLQFINNHVRKEVNGDLSYIDKLYVLHTWHNDLREEKIEHPFEHINIENTVIKINGVEFNFEFELPTITKDLAFLKYILNKNEELETIDALFYLTFRFLKQISFDDTTLEVSDIPTSETFYKHLDMSKIGTLQKHVDSSLESIQEVRNLELDARVFFA